MTREKQKSLNGLQMQVIGGKTVYVLDDTSEVNIGGVTYRVKSVFADKGQMGDLLDLATMEMISRSA